MRQGSNFSQLTDKTFSPVINGPGIKVVIFTSPSCMTCHQHLSYLESHQGDINAPLYEVNGMFCQGVIQQLGITKAPAVGVFRPNSSYVFVDAEQPTNLMVESINKVINSMNQEVQPK